MSQTICQATDSMNVDNEVNQNETSVNDTEILRRVMEIRSSWTVTERIQRKRAAEDRFSELLSKLDLSTVAA